MGVSQVSARGPRGGSTQQTTAVLGDVLVVESSRPATRQRVHLEDVEWMGGLMDGWADKQRVMRNGRQKAAECTMERSMVSRCIHAPG